MEEIKYSLLLRALICALALTAAFSLVSFSAAATEVRAGCVRLHILANSDSDEDQELKMKVRDALLSGGERLFSATASANEARAELEKSKDKLKAAAREVIAGEGYQYDTDIYICDEYFTTRSYGDYTLPAGRYSAVKVVIGEGKGRNWWCVIFPPLCLPGFCETEPEAYLTENGSKLIQEKPELEPRFMIVEWFEKLCDKIG